MARPKRNLSWIRKVPDFYQQPLQAEILVDPGELYGSEGSVSDHRIQGQLLLGGFVWIGIQFYSTDNVISSDVIMMIYKADRDEPLANSVPTVNIRREDVLAEHYMLAGKTGLAGFNSENPPEGGSITNHMLRIKTKRKWDNDSQIRIWANFDLTYVGIAYTSAFLFTTP